ncbi:MAG: FAD:protein FMN transferase [Clostridia bacterium]|nr:FAD:protein FMN transferase [Clostridia bacterium]
MKQRIYSIALSVCLLLCAMLSSCASEPQKNKYSAYSMDYFDTVITIVGYEYTEEEFDAVAEGILAEFEEYHRLYTIYHRFDGLENLRTINDLVDGAHRTVTVDRRIIDLLLYAREMYDFTDGTVNVAMGSVLSLWHDYRVLGADPATAALPPMERLAAAAKHTDITKMIIDEENCTVTLTDPLMKLDVGAIAKGYATECVARSLEERGVTGYILNVGGNIRAIGAKPDGSLWSVGIENPSGEEYLAYLELNGESVVTSGSYQRYYYVDGKPYHHIIHPDTLMPAEGFISVSVVCEDSGFGDALSTALFCLSLEEGLALVESTPELEAMWMSEDGTKTVSSGWNDFLKNKG